MRATRRILHAVAGVFLILPSPALGQAAAASRAAADRILTDIRYLADDAREGRGTGTRGLDSSASYIARRFQASGLAPGGSSGFFQPFTTDPSAPALAHAGIGAVNVKNVIGKVPGRGRLAGQVVVVGAHFDHLGLGGFGSLVPDSVNVIHNGADDNASGTAAVIEIGRRLAARPAAGDARTILLMAFTSEELGNIGSGYYVSHPIAPIESTYAMINLDMVGRLADDRLMVFGSATAREFPALVDSAVAPERLTVAGAGGDCFGASDHASFCSVKVPSLHFFTGIHDDYHKPSDDWEKINAEGTARVAGAVADLAWRLATRPGPLTYVDIPAPVRAAASGSQAYLGTVPDMASSPGGVRLQGVRGGSPAELAGIKAGDILVKIGAMEVKDLYGMTAALQAYQPGDVVDIVVKRGEEMLTFQTTLGRRGG